MKIGMITDSLPEADFDTMLGVAARLEMDMLEFGCGNWSSAPHIDLDGMLDRLMEQTREDSTGQLTSLSRHSPTCTSPPWISAHAIAIEIMVGPPG